jgi:hypothetical protein
MLLVFGDEGLDFGEFPDLMAEGRRIVAGQRVSAAAALRGLERYDLGAVLDGDQGPLLAGMPRLPAAVLVGPGPSRGRFGVGMLAAGGQRGVVGRLFQRRDLLFQFGDPAFIVLDDRLHDRPDLGSEGVQLLRRDRRRRHAADVAESRKSGNPNFTHRAVNGYIAIHLTLDEFQRLKRGSIPKSMDDKWFVFHEDDWVYCHRSWTGYCIYQLRFEQQGREMVVAEAWVNGEYRSDDLVRDQHAARFLLLALALQLPTDRRTGLSQ